MYPHRRRRLLVFALLVLVPAMLSGQQPARVPADQAGGEWLVEGAGRSGDVKIDTFLGRRSLWLRNSTQAIRAGAQLIDGTIEFDVAPMDHGDFVAIVFRRESLRNHENIYLRPRSSGEFMAVQYAPRMNGSSTWQLYRSSPRRPSGRATSGRTSASTSADRDWRSSSRTARRRSCRFLVCGTGRRQRPTSRSGRG